MNVQLIFVAGRATKDVEIFSTKKDKKKFAKFSVAVNEYRGKDLDEETTFYDVLISGKSIEKAEERIKKGDLVVLQGKPTTSAYMSKKDKQPKASMSILVESWKVLK